ncbi:MAG: NUDIX hydrolase [Vulcanisaeta sp.]|jgi:ADP-ribose pyrophosphatase|nr:MAG: NUDIX hydrolase [Vulcanisaeta sp. CIS_19]MCG2864576.1 NUDIX hydrolase [Vulcanisaeta sp.]MCG2866892.1 NUDIX hydrolase [Vulcanisaeta sp.]PVU72587.1 NUDIX hydrolase [Vulcanisaeta sp. SCGC AB-777_J10]
MIIYKGRRITLDVSNVILPNGHEMKVEKVIFPRAVAVLPIYGNNVILIKQYRPAIGKYIIEIPAGVVGDDERVEDALVRELREEVGAEINYYEKLFEGFTSPGYSTEYLFIYYANVKGLGEPKPEPHEVINKLIIGIGEAYDMLRKGEINDVKTALALTLYLNLKGRV